MPDTRQLDLLDPAPPAIGPAPVTADVAQIAAALSKGVRLGTSTWSFPGWAGIVYDRAASKQVLAQEGLTAYAQHPLLRTVSVDRSFYGPLDTATWGRYAQAVPTDFRFLVKAPRTATMARLDGRSNPLFLDANGVAPAIETMIEGLCSHLGPVVFQFPPGRYGAPTVFARRLQEFLRGLPAGPLYAVELRTSNLLGPAYTRALIDTGTAHCLSVHPGMPGPAEQARRLGTHLSGAYVARWNLGGGQRYEAARERYRPFYRIIDPDPESRRELVDGVRDALRRGEEAWVILNNKAEGSGPLSAIELARELVRM